MLVKVVNSGDSSNNSSSSGGGAGSNCSEQVLRDMYREEREVGRRVVICAQQRQVWEGFIKMEAE